MRSRAWQQRSILSKLLILMGDPRNEDDAEDTPISVDSATRSAKTAAALGRAPKLPVTAKIDKFDLDEAIEKSKEVDEPSDPATPSAPPVALPKERPKRAE